MTASPLRAAIIGTGGIANEHVHGIRAHPHQVELVAAADTNPNNLTAFCQKHGIDRPYDSAETLLKHERPDVVAICTPPFTHASLAAQAMEHGAHVLCEKPLVISLAELEQLRQAEARTGRVCASVFQWRCGSAAKHVKRLIESGVLGKPFLALANTLWFRDAHYYTGLPWRGRWQTEGGGVALGHGIHAMDMTLWLLGEWAEVDAQIATPGRDIEIETLALARVQFASGAHGCFTTSVVSPREVSSVRLDFEFATIELEHLYRYQNENWRFTRLASLPPDQDADWSQIPENIPGSMAAQWGDLTDALRAGTTVMTSAARVESTYDFLASLYKSAHTRQPVRRGSIQPDDPFYHAMNGDTTQRA
jgi:predicted dehydrogenase